MKLGWVVFLVGSVAASGCGGARSPLDDGAVVDAGAGGGGGAGQGGATPSGPPDHGVFGSGTRLRASYIDAGGGAVSFVRFQDTLLDVPCDFTPMSDGSLRCLPRAAPVTSDFADAACTRPLARVTGCEPASPYAVKTTVTCAQTTGISYGEGGVAAEIYAVGAAALGQTFVRDPDGGCFPADPPSGGETLHEIGAVVAPTTFVGATVSTMVHDGRAQVIRYDGDDGSYRLSDRPHDAALDVDCSPFLLFQDDADRCIPSYGALIDYPHYADAGCTQAVARQATDYAASCAAPTVAEDSVPGATVCDPYVARYFAVGEAVTQVYSGKPGACQVSTDTHPDIERYFKLGAPLPATTFFPKKSVEIGSSRVHLERSASLDGAPLDISGSFVDATAGEGCYLVVDPAGVGRCLPYSAQDYHSWLFADAQCTDALAIFGGDKCPVDAPYLLSTGPNDSNTCFGGSSRSLYTGIFEAEPYGGPTYTVTDAGTCKPYDHVAHSIVLFRRGASVSFDRLARLDFVTD